MSAPKKNCLCFDKKVKHLYLIQNEYPGIIC